MKTWQEDFLQKLVEASQSDARLATAKLRPRKLRVSFEHPQMRMVECLFDSDRPTVWEQVSDYIDNHGSIGNTEVRTLMRTDDTLKASRQIMKWVKLGLLEVANPLAAKRFRKYTKPDIQPTDPLLSKLER